MGSSKVALILAVVGVATSASDSKPNLVVIMADDLGWDDVSFHGSDQILTPNIDMLAYSGVAMSRYYSHAICTPSRSAFMSGKYPYTLGMQGNPLTMSENRAIPSNVTLLPEYLKKAGYKTHLVGKWHVGASQEKYLPTNRGFDSHYGHRGGFMDYYDYTLEETFTTGRVCGFTLYKNLTPDWNAEGYITDLYTEAAESVIENHETSSPLFLMLAHNAPHAGNEYSSMQAPPELVREMRYMELSERRIFGATMKKLDESVGRVVKSLHDKGILNNTIIIFIADNGGMSAESFTQNYASNYPFRGTKMSPFEGGVRVVGLVWSANFTNTNNYNEEYIHVTDWLPTLLTAAGCDVPSDIDGINQWDSINGNAKSNRTTMYEIDDYTGYASVTYGDLKMITGNVPKLFSTYLGEDLRRMIAEPPSYSEALKNSTVYSVLNSLGMSYNEDVRTSLTITCDRNSTSSCYSTNDTVCLYNIKEDPCETTDISADYPDEITTMKALLETEMKRKIARVVPLYRDPLSAPSLHNYTWAPWIESSS